MRLLSRGAAGAAALAACGFAVPAFAGCDTTGSVTVSECDSGGARAWVGSGTASFTVKDLTVNSPDGDYGAISLRGPDTGFVDETLNIEGSTTVTTTGANGALARTEDGNITINTGPDVTINSSGKGLVGWVNVNGAISITNYATINAGLDDSYTNHGSEAGTEGIDGSAHGEDSGVTITNYGAVTSTYGRGIYADGGSTAGDIGTSVPVAVTITNYGTVDGWLAGARAIDYYGTASVYNAEGASITSHNHQAVVAWSNKGDAVIENRGAITADNGAGVLAWGSDGVTVDNYGTVSATYIDRATTSVSWYGVEAWVQTAGTATITNHAGATVTATHSDGLYAHSESGSATVTNDGSVFAANAAIRAATVGGSISATNGGWLGADGTDGAVVFSGTAVTDAGLDNRAGGVIVASSALTVIPGVGELDALSGPEQALFETAVAGKAVAISAEADTLAVTNAGTILGNIAFASSEDATPTGAGTIDNSGLWAFSGASGFSADLSSGSIDNTGTVWALGDSTLTGNLVNDAMLEAGSLGGQPGRLTLDGNYSAGTAAQFAFDFASVNADPDRNAAVLRITGDVTGTTSVALSDPQSLANVTWSDLPHGTVIAVDGSAAKGASSFTMNQTYGLITVGLDYSAGDQSWLLGYGTAPAGNALAQMPGAGNTLVTDFFNDIEDHLSQVRTDTGSGGDQAPLGYAATPVDPTLGVMANRSTGQPHAQAWTRGSGEYATGDGYDRAAAQVAGGIDTSVALSADSRLILGLAANFGSDGYSFAETGARETLSGPGIGAYAGLASGDGRFVDLDVAWQSLSAALDLSGATVNTQGNSYGARITAGRRFMHSGLEITPWAAVTASHTALDGFQMQGLQVGFAGGDAVAAEAGLKVARRFLTDYGTLTPFGSVMVGDRAVSGGEVTISDTGSYVVDGGAYGRAALGVALANPLGTSTARLWGSVTRDVNETSGGVWLGTSVAW